MENDDHYAVPDTWEEAADDPASKILRQKLDEAAKLKHQQQIEQQQQLAEQQQTQQQSSTTSNMNGEQRLRPHVVGTGAGPVIKILKRPESSGELSSATKTTTTKETLSSWSATVAASGPTTLKNNSASGSNAAETTSNYYVVGATVSQQQQQHYHQGSAAAQQQPPHRKSSATIGSGIGDGRQSSLSFDTTKTLEERATAYAQARERIFGVADPVVHEDLPILPKFTPKATKCSPPTTIQSSSSSK